MIGADASELVSAVDGIRRRGRQLDRAMADAAEVLVGAVMDVYAARGPGWEPLSDATVLRRGGSGVLVDTGRMRGSTSASHGSSWAEAASGAPYARFHVRGTGRMPRRDPSDIRPFEQRVAREVSEILFEVLQ